MGVTLGRIIQFGGLDAPTRKIVIISLYEGLNYLKSKGIIHRDIKPENLILQPDKSVQIIDFGMSFYLGTDPIYIKAGTPVYMSPEVHKIRDGYEGPISYDFGIDMFSAGLTHFLLIKGAKKIFNTKTYEITLGFSKIS